MARGRTHAPPGTQVGVWFQHRGTQSAGPVKRLDDTSTGAMLSGPYRSTSAHHPVMPPAPFDKKANRNYRTSNRFSEHDNRNSFQSHGVYFGNGRDGRQLGRNLIDTNMRIHKTEKDFLSHEGREFVNYDYKTTYNKSYLGKDTEQPKNRRFQKSLPLLEPTGRVQLSTTTTDWFPSDRPEHRTNTQVLAVSQEPFLQHNPWQYAYHSKRNVYPPYDSKRQPVIDNTFNRYGAAFNSSGSFNSTGLSPMETTGCS